MIVAGLAPLPGVKFLGPEWRELFRHAVREAARLKIEMGFNMAGGWVMIGPWVTPDNAMKKVAQSELKVRGLSPHAVRSRFRAWRPKYPSGTAAARTRHSQLPHCGLPG